MTQALVMYSGGCRVCRAVARWLVRRGVAVCPIRDPRAEEFLADLRLDQRVERWWLILEDRQHGGWVRYSGCGGKALPMLLRVMWPRLAAVLLWVGPVADWVDALDSKIKHWRPRIAPWISDGPAPVELGMWERREAA